MYVGVRVGTDDPFAGFTSTGAAGATRSTVNETGSLVGDTLPAASVETAVATYVPSTSGAVGATANTPVWASAVVVPRLVVPRNTSTLDPFSAVPVIVGLGFVIVEPSAGAVITGAAGLVTSTVKSTRLLTSERLPAASTATAVAKCGPSASASESTENVPPAVAVVGSSVAPSTVTSTRAFASAVPLIVGVVSLRRAVVHRHLDDRRRRSGRVHREASPGH